MKLGMIGMGRMGGNMAQRLVKAGHHVVASDLSAENVKRAVNNGAAGSSSMDDLIAKLGSASELRAVWVMLPSGEPTETTVANLGERLAKGDIVIDGGNSHYKDDVRRSQLLAKRGIRYLDVGVSGGIWGLERGYCLMIGGEREAASWLDPVFRALAPGQGDIEPSPGRGAAKTADQGYLYCGPSGSGHFVKMVHNGIEYGLMQAYAEGFDLLRGTNSPELAPELRYELDLTEIAEVWRRGSVVSSWLLDLVARALNKSPKLAEFQGRVPDSGEGRWTVEAALEAGVPVTVLAASLFSRFRSREPKSFADQMLSAMRSEFGGHLEAKP